MVVAAINRLDGRQYAVKKIKMQSQSPQGFSRLIREVTTLSRLQHPHVVRYFQVGFRGGGGGVGGVGRDEWGRWGGRGGEGLGGLKGRNGEGGGGEQQHQQKHHT